MCGLIGYVKNSKKHTGTLPYKYAQDVNKIIRQGLYVDALRGHDSTGLACVSMHSNRQPVVYKRALQALDFLGHPTSQKILKSIEEYKYILGHNRAATKGFVEDTSAHPFQSGHIILTHNGTLHNEKVLQGNNSFEVDSEALCYHIAQHGMTGIKEVDGAFALAWYDTKEDSVNFLRNDERPLWFIVEKKYNDIFYGSELGMLKWLAERNNIEVESSFFLQKGQHLKITDDVERMSVKQVDLMPPKSFWSGAYGSHYRSTADYYDGYGMADPYANNWRYQSNKEDKQDTDRLKKEREKLYCAQAEEFLSTNYGVAIGDEIEIEIDAFNRYHTNDKNAEPKGDLFGRYRFKDDKDCIVAAFNVSRSTLANLDIRKPIKAQIVGLAQVPVKEVNNEIAKECVKKYGEESKPLGIRVSSNILSGTPMVQGNEKPSSRRVRDRKSNNDKAIQSIEVEKDQQYNKGGTPPKFFRVEGSPIKTLSQIPSVKNEQTIHDHAPDAEDYMPGPNEVLIPIHRWLELVKDGCAWCSSDITEEEALSVSWTANQEPLCPDCVMEDDGEETYYGIVR